jgi:hypothetical protein
MPRVFTRLKEGLLSLVAIGLGITIVVNLVVPAEGPKYCAAQFRSAYPQLFAQSSITKRVWARTQGDHWLAALVVQPFDIEQQPSTVVCHFARTNFVYGRVDLFHGDKVAKLKEVSVSNLVPTTWFQ